MKRKKARNIALTLEGAQLNTALALIAGLIGDKDRTKEQGRYVLTAEMLPDTMPFERAVLRAIYSMSEERIAPTRDSLTARLLMDFQDAEKRLGDLLSHRSAPNPKVQTHAWSLGDWMARRRMLAAAIEQQAILSQQVGNAQDAYNEASAVWASVAPRSSNIQIVSADEADDEFLRRQRDNHHIIASGKTLGPTLPWEGLRHLVPYLKAGDLTAIMARTKHGKTILSQMICEWIAYRMKEFTEQELIQNHDGEQGYEVDFFHFETDLYSMQERRYCRLLRIHIADMYSIVLEDNPLTRRRVAEIRGCIRDAKEYGRLNYVSCPGMTWGEMEIALEQGKARAEANGRKYVALFDYFQKMDWAAWNPDETKGLNRTATKLKELIQGMGIFSIAMAQFGIDASGSKRTAFGGTVLQQAAQTSIKLNRFRNSDSEQRKDDDGYDVQDNRRWTIGGIQQVNIFGDDIYRHTIDDVGSDAEFHVVFQNQPGRMGKSPCYAVNGYFDFRDEYDDKRWLETRNGGQSSRTPDF